MRDKWLITGASGYIGSLLVQRLSELIRSKELEVEVTGIDIVPNPSHQDLIGYKFQEMDVRDPSLAAFVAEGGFTQVAHLASLVDPSHKSDSNLEYKVDVLGTKNVVEACLSAGVAKIVVTSSGAAYGYHPDNPVPITEEAALRGNEEFTYARNKKLVEEMLAEYRSSNPELTQIILRMGTIIGPGVNNRISSYLESRFLLKVKGADSPFVFISEEDIAEVLVAALKAKKGGTFNIAGDGALTISEIARIMHSRVISLPEVLLRAGFTILKKLGISRYGPELVTFLKYRPVLSNQRLKENLFQPRYTSREAFEIFAHQHHESNSARRKARKNRLEKLSMSG